MKKWIPIAIGLIVFILLIGFLFMQQNKEEEVGKEGLIGINTIAIDEAWANNVTDKIVEIGERVSVIEGKLNITNETKNYTTGSNISVNNIDGLGGGMGLPLPKQGDPQIIYGDEDSLDCNKTSLIWSEAQECAR